MQANQALISGMYTCVFPMADKVPLQIRIDANLKKQVAKAAIDKEVSVSELVEEVLKDNFGDRTQKGKTK